MDMVVLPIGWAMDMAPSDHIEHVGYLRITGLPANEMSNTVLVVKLEFDSLPEVGPLMAPAANDLLRR